jgi:hypothetical protein
MFRSLQPIVAALALAAMVAACTGTAGGPGVATLDDPSASSAPTPSPSAVTPQDAALAFARCMRENGVDMPDPIVETDGGGGISIGQAGPDSTVSKDAFREADETCRHFMEAAMPEAGPPLSAEDMDKMLAFAQCMREHGVDMEDPTADGGIRVQIGGSTQGDSGGAPVFEAELEAAHEACNSLLPGRMGEKMNNVGGGPADEAPKNFETNPAGSN